MVKLWISVVMVYDGYEKIKYLNPQSNLIGDGLMVYKTTA